MSPAAVQPLLAAGATIPHRPSGLHLRVPRGLLEGTGVSPSDPHWDSGEQVFHLAPRSGWGSDPHGPIYWRGRYHLFYQATPATCQWYWGLRWDHAVSDDLVTWTRLPPAIVPTPGGLDADGCFTGNIQVHPATGVPMLFYTGARLRHNPTLTMPDPPLDACNPLMFHWETQLCAVADPGDELLVKWTKVATPWMELPHCAYLTAWRDPFFAPPRLDPTTGQPVQPAKQPAPCSPALLQSQDQRLTASCGNPTMSLTSDTAAAAGTVGACVPRGPAPPSTVAAAPAASTTCLDNATPPSGSGSTGQLLCSGSSGTTTTTALSSESTSGAATTHINAQGADTCGTSPAAAALSHLASSPAVDGTPAEQDGALQTSACAMSPPSQVGPRMDASQDQARLDEASSSNAAGFYIQEDDEGYMMLIGSGLEGLGGTALIYRSPDLARGWRFSGYLCTWPNLQTGFCWECPHLLHLPDLPPGLSCMAATANTTPSSTHTYGQSPSAADMEAAYARTKALADYAWAAATAAPAATSTPATASALQAAPRPPSAATQGVNMYAAAAAAPCLSLSSSGSAGPSPATRLQSARSLSPEHMPVVLPVRSQSSNVLHGRHNSAPEIDSMLPIHATAEGMSYSTPWGIPDQNVPLRLPKMRSSSEDADVPLHSVRVSSGRMSPPTQMEFASDTSCIEAAAWDSQPISSPFAHVAAAAAAPHASSIPSMSTTAAAGGEWLEEGGAVAMPLEAVGEEKEPFVADAAATASLKPVSQLPTAPKHTIATLTPALESVVHTPLPPPGVAAAHDEQSVMPPGTAATPHGHAPTQSTGTNGEGADGFVGAGSSAPAAMLTTTLSALSSSDLASSPVNVGTAWPQHGSASSSVGGVSLAATSAASAALAPQMLQRARTAGAVASAVSAATAALVAGGAGGSGLMGAAPAGTSGDVMGRIQEESEEQEVEAGSGEGVEAGEEERDTSVLGMEADGETSSQSAMSSYVAAASPTSHSTRATPSATASAHCSTSQLLQALMSGLCNPGTLPAPAIRDVAASPTPAHQPGTRTSSPHPLRRSSSSGLGSGAGEAAPPTPQEQLMASIMEGRQIGAAAVVAAGSSTSTTAVAKAGSGEGGGQAECKQSPGPSEGAASASAGVNAALLPVGALSQAPDAVQMGEVVMPVAPDSSTGVSEGNTSVQSMAPQVQLPSVAAAPRPMLLPPAPSSLVRKLTASSLADLGTAVEAAAVAVADAATTLDIKAATEAGMAGLGHASVLSLHAPHDVAQVTRRTVSHMVASDVLAAGLPDQSLAAAVAAAPVPHLLLADAVTAAAAAASLVPTATQPPSEGRPPSATTPLVADDTAAAVAHPVAVAAADVSPLPASVSELVGGLARDAAAAEVGAALASVFAAGAEQAAVAAAGSSGTPPSSLLLAAAASVQLSGLTSSGMPPPAAGQVHAPSVSAPVVGAVPVTAPVWDASVRQPQVLKEETEEEVGNKGLRGHGALDGQVVSEAVADASGLKLLHGGQAARVSSGLEPAGLDQGSVADGKVLAGTAGAAAAVADGLKRGLPTPPAASRSEMLDINQVRAACRAYAEAAAAVQGFDLGLPPTDAEVVKRVTHGPPAVPQPARPDQRWFLGFAPDAATYGIVYFLGAYSRDRFHLADAQGPYKLDLGNVLYAPLAFYDQRAGRHLVWGYLKELRTLPPPPSICNKYVSSGCVSLPRALYLRDGRLFQVPLPEMASLRLPGAVWRAPPTLLLPSDGPLVVPGPRAGGVGGDHLDMELVLRRVDAAARTVLLLDSWRPGRVGAAALVYHWATHRLELVFDVHTPRHARRVWGGSRPLRTKAVAAASAGAVGPVGNDLGADAADTRIGSSSGSSSVAVGGGAAGADAEHHDVLPHASTPVANGSLATEVAAAGNAPGNCEEGQGRLKAGGRKVADVQAAQEVGQEGDDSMHDDDSMRDDDDDDEEEEEEEEEEEATAAAPSHTHHPGVGLPGGLHTLDDDDGADYQLFVDPKVPPVPDMNPEVPEWLRMRRHAAGGVLDVSLQPAGSSELALRLFIDGSAVEVFTGTGQTLSTRVYRGNPALEELLGTPSATQAAAPTAQATSGTAAVDVDCIAGSTRRMSDVPAAALMQEGGTGGKGAAAGGPALSLWSVDGVCEVARWEVHRVRSAWLRGDADAPLPAPVTREHLERWVAEGLYNP